MSDHYDKALETIRELEQQQRDEARNQARQTSPPAEAERTFEEQLAERLQAAQSRWLTFTDKEFT